jgi:geranylgeranyl reductase family protein
VKWGRSLARMTRAALVADVVVVGGGPAGAAAAATAARLGLDVALVDRARFPRDKCCGDGLTTAALRLLDDLGLGPDTVPSWRVVDAAWVRSPSGRVAAFPLPEGQGQFAAVAPRSELDAALVDVARAAGVKVLDGHALVGGCQRADRVVLDIDGLGRVHTRYAIGADGVWSPLRKQLGLAVPGYLGEWHAFRQYANGVTGSAAKRLWVWFEADLLPGYAWSFPLPNGRVNVGFGVLRGGRHRVRDMKRLWPDVLARDHVAAALGPEARLDASHRAWPIPARIDRVILGHHRALFVGDAAAAADPLTGEGIAQALLTGRLAAEAIARGGALRPETVQAEYGRAAHRALVADHRMASALGNVLAHPVAARGAVRVAGATPWTRRNFGRWLFEDEGRAALLTPRRWHRHFLAGRGAYA